MERLLPSADVEKKDLVKKKVKKKGRGNGSPVTMTKSFVIEYYQSLFLGEGVGITQFCNLANFLSVRMYSDRCQSHRATIFPILVALSDTLS